jgi:hypothetical protein
MRELRDLLQQVRTDSSQLSLDGFCESVDDQKITAQLVADGHDTGMRFVHDCLEWRLRPDLAEEFAEKVDVLASVAAGHQYLEASFSGDDIRRVSIRQACALVAAD